MRRALALAVAIVALIAGGGCSGASTNRDAPAGPYAAGVTTATVDGSPVDIWFPADRASTRGRPRDAYDVRDWLPPALAGRVPPGVFTFTTDAYRDVPPAAGGPFPLVLFAHGLYSFRDQSTFLTTWLASWGYVVAAPELPARDLTAFFAEDSHIRPGAPPDGQVLADTEQVVAARLGSAVSTGKVAVIGHSQGGIDAMQVASRPDVATYVALAAGFQGSHPPLPPVPSLYIAGGDDHAIPPALVRDVYDTAPAPKRLVVLGHAGHLAFTDLCLVGAAAGGLGALGHQLGMALAPGSPFTPAALDGCGSGSLPADSSRVRREVLAALRAAPVGR